MTRKFSLFFALISVVIASCSKESGEQAANREYVSAAGDVSKAALLFDNAEYSEALSLCKKAVEKVGKIVEEHPESSVAFKIITDPKIRIGACEYDVLRDYAIPEMEKIANPRAKSVELAWAYACSSRNFVKLAEALFRTNPHSSETIEIAEECAKYSDNKSDAREIYGMISRAKNSSLEKSAPKKEAGTKIPSGPSIKSDDLIKRTERAVNLIVFDINSIDELGELCRSAKVSDAKTSEKFGELLDKAAKNIERISVPSLRIQAAEKLALVFAEFGEETKALAVSSQIPDSPEKSKFLIKMIGEIAKKQNFDEALEITKILKRDLDKYSAYGKTARFAKEYGDEKTIKKIASLVDPSSPCFDSFLLAIASSPNKIESTISASELFSKSDPKVAELLAKRSAAMMLKKTDSIGKPDLTNYAMRISDVFLLLNLNSDALSFASAIAPKCDHKTFCDYFCKLGLEFKKRGEKDLSVSAFSNSVNESDAVSLAVAVYASGLDKKSAFEILKDILPKFGNFSK